MSIWALPLLFILNTAFADSSAFIKRGDKKIPFNPETKIELNDEIHSGSAVMLVQLDPQTKVSLAANTELLITEDSYIDLKKGMVRLRITKENQVVRGESFSFRGRGLFEVSLEDNANVSLNVTEGLVEASSPYIQSFVPEIVKAKEGLQFNDKKKIFVKKKYSPKFKS